MARTLKWLGIALAFPVLCQAQEIANVSVSDTVLKADIQLAGETVVELTLTFEKVVGLSLANLGLSALEISPTDPTLLSRLPASVSIPAGLPILITIEPPAAGGLAFSGVVAIEAYTHQLAYTPGCPLRLFAAPLGGAFRDTTVGMGGGSYRVRGDKPDFSEFLVVTDLRPVDPVIEAKFVRLDQDLDANSGAIKASVLADLTARLDAAWAAYRAGDLTAAIREVEAFIATVKAHSGGDIPDVWRASRDLVNVAGKLRAAAATLRYSLTLKSNSLL